MKVLSYIKDLDGSTYHRVFMPNRSIDAEVREKKNISEADLEWCDILHYSRHTVLSTKLLDKMRAKYGFKIVVDNDDWWETPKDHPMYEFWKKSNIGLSVRNHMMNADAVITTTDTLAAITPNDNVFVLPNALDYGHGQFAYRKQRTSDRVRLLYASTIMNYSNTSLIMPAMPRLAGLDVEVVIAGHHESPFFDILVNNLTGGKLPYRFTKWLPSQEYMTGYEGDIMILPSKSTEFNRYKSNLKVLEAAALRIPIVVSEAEPYLNMPVNYFNGVSSFIEQVTKLVQDESYRNSCADKLYEFCSANYSLRSWSKKRLQTYEIIQRGHSHNGEAVASKDDRQHRSPIDGK